MAQGDAIFARTNCDWPMDARCRALTPVQKWINHVLWLSAVKERTSTLPAHYHTKYIALLADTDTRSVKKAVAQMQHLCLIDVLEDGRIKVNGVKSNNKKIHWKEDSISTPLPPPIQEDIDSMASQPSQEKKKGERKQRKETKKGKEDRSFSMENFNPEGEESYRNEIPPWMASFHEQFKMHSRVMNSYPLVKFADRVKNLISANVEIESIKSVYMNKANKFMEIWDLDKMILENAGLIKPKAPAMTSGDKHLDSIRATLKRAQEEHDAKSK